MASQNIPSIGRSSLRINPNHFAVRRAQWSKEFLVKCVICNNRTAVASIHARQFLEKERKRQVNETQVVSAATAGEEEEEEKTVDNEDERMGLVENRYITVKCFYCAKPAEVPVKGFVEGIATAEARRSSSGA